MDRFMIGAVLPTAASASLLANLPSIILSAVLNNCWTIPVATSGSVKSRIFFAMEPCSISI